ncbi:hypothetical protein FRC02_001178, partial [Tulasnella sp. 418]
MSHQALYTYKAAASNQPAIVVSASASSSAYGDGLKTSRKHSSSKNDVFPSPDLMTRIKGMYRLLDLYKEQGSSGLVDKILIAQESLATLMNQLAPGSHAFLTKISFASLDVVTIQPLGIYGDKAAIVQFLHMVAGLDDETAAYLLTPTDTFTAARLKQPTLASGLYFLLPESNSPTPDALYGHRSFIIYWPEDTTWDDTAIGAVCRNRTTFMRYLTKLTPQIRALISREYADTIVWKGADEEMDCDQDDYHEGDSDDDDANHERFFKFEVSRTTEQEEGADIYPGFEFGHRAIVTPTFPSDMMVPDTISDSLQCRLITGETKQGFLSTRFIPYQKDSNIINMTLNKLGLSGLLAQHQNIHLGKDVTEEGLFSLMNDGGLQQRADRLTNQWRSDMKTWSDSSEKEIKERLAQLQTSITVARQELIRQARIRIAGVFTGIFPFLDPARLRGTQLPSDDEANPDFWNDLFAKHPSALKAETEVVDPKRLSHISCHKYNAVKKRVLDKEDQLQGCEGLSKEDRKDLFLEIIHDERKNHGIWAKLSNVASAAGKVLRGDNRPREDPSKTTDSEFMAILDDMAQRSHMRPLVEEIYDLISNWA